MRKLPLAGIGLAKVLVRAAPSARPGPGGSPRRRSGTAVPAHPGLGRHGPHDLPQVPCGCPDRVILIERCNGVQVGQDNDQYSVYQVTLPAVTLESEQELAERLLARNAPWSRDLFSHDARRPPTPFPPARNRAASIDLIAGVTDEVTDAVSPPQIDGWPGEVHDRTGIQIGGPPSTLERQILKSAADLDQFTARHPEPSSPPPVTGPQTLATAVTPALRGSGNHHSRRKRNIPDTNRGKHS